MRISHLTSADTEAVISLWHQAGLTRPWNPPERDLQRALDGDTSTVFGGFVDERLVGTVMVGKTVTVVGSTTSPWMRVSAEPGWGDS
jgi:hypothetical protein